MNQPKSETPLAGGASGNAIALGQRANTSQQSCARSMGAMPFARYIANRFASPDEVLADFMPEAIDAAAQVGAKLLHPLELDGGRHYLRNANGRNDRRQYYIGRFERAADGTVWPCVTFSTFKAGTSNVYFNPRNLVWKQFQASRTGAQLATNARRAEYAQKAEARMRQQAEKEAQRVENDAAGHLAAANAALAVWISARAFENHFYLESKRVGAYGLRVAKKTSNARFWKADQEWWTTMTAAKAGDLLIPMFDIDGKLWNVQRVEAIPHEGSYPRRFLPGSRKRGLFYRIGGEGPAWLVEGYATGATVHAATGMPVFVAFDCANLAEVARKLPGIVVAVAADNDPSGAGEKGARQTGLPYVMPPTVGHDWNDHVRECGLASARELLGALNAA